jgi:hypothetical protein
MLATTAERVSANTDEQINERIRQQTEANVARFAHAGPAAIERRLMELDQEWDVERCVETMAPTFTLLGLGLSMTVSRRWLLLPIAVQGFFLQHALQGWCPPIPFLRWLGVRTMPEIEEERHALKALRGDYRSVPVPNNDNAAQQAMAAAQR